MYTKGVGLSDKSQPSMSKRRLLKWLSCALPLTAIGFLFSASVVAQGNPEALVVSPQQEIKAESLRTYWTEERMNAAQVLDLGVEGIAPMQNRQVEPFSSGKQPFVVPARPGELQVQSSAVNDQSSTQYSVADAPQADSLNLAVDDTGVDLLAGTYPFSFTGYDAFPDVAPLYEFFPFRVVGKLYFTIPSVGDFVCSASVVNTPNLSSLITAGHCVYDPSTQQFSTNVLFAPAHYNGVNTYDTFTAISLVTLAGWTQGLLEYDMGGIYLNRGGPAPSTYLVGQLGALGFLANADRTQHWHSDGYPAAPPFTGGKQHFCAATWAVNDQPTGTAGVDPETMGIGCDSTGGSSGGPWIVDLNGSTSTGNLINGLNSYGYVGVANQMYGPYFGDAAVALYNWLAANPIP